METIDVENGTVPIGGSGENENGKDTYTEKATEYSPPPFVYKKGNCPHTNQKSTPQGIY